MRSVNKDPANPVLGKDERDELKFDAICIPELCPFPYIITTTFDMPNRSCPNRSGERCVLQEKLEKSREETNVEREKKTITCCLCNTKKEFGGPYGKFWVCQDCENTMPGEILRLRTENEYLKGKIDVKNRENTSLRDHITKKKVNDIINMEETPSERDWEKTRPLHKLEDSNDDVKIHGEKKNG